MTDHVHILLRITKDSNVEHDSNFHGIHPLEKQSLSSIINHYKGKVTNALRKKGYPYFEWQKSYNDRLIFSRMQYDLIIDYIKKNPKAWCMNKREVKLKMEMDRLNEIIRKLIKQ